MILSRRLRRYFIFSAYNCAGRSRRLTRPISANLVMAPIFRVLDNLAGGMVFTRAKLRDCLAVKNERLGEARVAEAQLAG